MPKTEIENALSDAQNRGDSLMRERGHYQNQKHFFNINRKFPNLLLIKNKKFQRMFLLRQSSLEDRET